MSDSILSADVSIDYTNWRGERARRHIRPITLTFRDGTPYHPGEQWLLLAFDVEKGENRSFAMKDIHSWGPVR